MSEGDQQRVFGRFRWGAYSPAGALERNGFFWRQVRRQSGQERGRVYRAVAYMTLAWSLALLGVAAIGLVVFVARLVG